VISGQTGSYSVLVANSSGSATNGAVVTITNPPPQVLFANPNLSANNGLVLNLGLSVGNNYDLQASTNLSDWSILAAFYCNGTNTICFDPLATNFSKRFYRLVSP